MRLSQLHNLLDITGKNKMVTAHYKLILIDGNSHAVKMTHLHQTTTIHIYQARVT